MRSSRVALLALLAIFLNLAWACDRDGENPSAEGQTPYGIGLYDLNTRTFRSIPLDGPVNRPGWVEDGVTFFAIDHESGQWGIYDLDGNLRRQIPTERSPDGGNRTELYPAADGRHIVIARGDDPLVLLDVTTGDEATFPLIDDGGLTRAVAFSPDGRSVAYTSTQDDRTSVVLADADGLNARGIKTEDDPDREMFVGPASWSPDSKWLRLSVTVCPRGADPECHMATGYSTQIIDLDGTVVWQTPESPDLDFPQWAGPSRIFLVKDEGEFPQGPTFKYIDVPTLKESDAPIFFSYTTNVSPNGEFALDLTGGSGLEECIMRDAASGNELLRGGCGIESWTRDGRQALIWDTTCSAGIRDDHVCVAGRYLGPATPTPESEEDATADAYVPGDICSTGEGHRVGLTPSSATPIPDPAPETLTPALVQSLARFADTSFHITYNACIEVKKEMRVFELVWYKDGQERSRYDVLEIVDGRKQFLLSYILSAGGMVVCSDRLGPYLNAVFADFDDFGPAGFGEAVAELSQHERACMSDPHGALFFFAPMQQPFGGGDPFSEAGVSDALPDEDGELSVRGAWKEVGTKTIAGVDATCYEAPYQPERALCFSGDGMLLYASETASIEAVGVEAEVSDSDFEPYHDVKAEIGRCFPRKDEPPVEIDVEEAIGDGDIEKALSSALLTLDDLECSWSEPLPRTDEPEEDSGCAQYCCLGPNTETLDSDEAEVEFAVVESYRDLDPYEVNHLRQSVRLYEGDDATAFMQQVRDYWRACAEHTFESERGDLITVRASEVTTSYGDESIGYLLTFNHNAYGDYVIQYVRRGRLISILSYYDGALGIRDPERLRAVGPADALMTLATEKLDALSEYVD